MSSVFEPHKSNKEKVCSQKIIQLPQRKCLSQGLFQGAWFLHIQVSSLSLSTELKRKASRAALL